MNDDNGPIRAALMTTVNVSFGLTQTTSLAVVGVVSLTGAFEYRPLQTAPPIADPIQAALAAAIASLEAGANAPRAAGDRKAYAIDEFRFDTMQDKFWCLVDRQLRSPEAVDAMVPMHRWREGYDANNKHRLLRPSVFIRRMENNLMVESSTWWPGQPEVIQGWSVTDGVMRPCEGARLYNTYVPPDALVAAESGVTAERWIEHVKRVWPESIEHNYFFDYCAHAIQRPGEKCNTALVLAGEQKVGKDTALKPLRVGVGQGNALEIEPEVLDGQFNGYRQTVVLIINEIRPKHTDFHATAFYQSLKPLAAAPPPMLEVNEKFMHRRWVLNLVRVILTTNDWLSMYIPKGDRREFVMLSPLAKDWHIAEHGPTYFADLWRWMDDEGGVQAAVRWLASRDLSHFDPKAESPKTEGWKQIVEGNVQSDTIAIAVDMLIDRAATGARPTVILSQQLNEIAASMDDERRTDLQRALKGKLLHYRLSDLGYELVPNEAERWTWRTKDGQQRRSRAAFVLRSSGLRGDGAREAVHRFGRVWADEF